MSVERSRAVKILLHVSLASMLLNVVITDFAFMISIGASDMLLRLAIFAASVLSFCFFYREERVAMERDKSARFQSEIKSGSIVMLNPVYLSASDDIFSMTFEVSINPDKASLPYVDLCEIRGEHHFKDVSKSLLIHSKLPNSKLILHRLKK